MAKQRVVANRLATLLAEKGRKERRHISQRQLAEDLGIAKVTINRWFRNDVDYSKHEIILKLCDYFGCEIGDLLVIEEVEIENDSPEFNARLMAEPA